MAGLPLAAWPAWPACAAAAACWLIAGPLQAASAAAPPSATAPVPSRTSTPIPAHGSGPAAGASAPAVPADAAWQRAQRRCDAHPVRAVRNECLARAQREHAAAASAASAASAPR